MRPAATRGGVRRLILALRERPAEVIDYALGRLRGQYYRALFLLLGKRVRVGRGLRVRGRLIIRGPGRVEFGDRVLIDGRGQSVTPFTYHPSAVLRIGNDVFVNGTRFACAVDIQVGDRGILSDARIADTDFHGTAPADRRRPEAVLPKRVSIGENAWIGMGVYVLKGVSIGMNSVIGAGAVVVTDIPANVVAAGNPARVIRRFSVDAEPRLVTPAH